MKIYLIRHGQTTSDVEDRYGGDYDDHLTELGKTQAKDLAQKLKGKGIQNIFASNRIRAQETAKILNNELKVSIETLDGIRERNLYGPLTGMVKSEALEKHPDLVERIKNTNDTIEGAELAKDFVDRVVKSFWEIAKSNHDTVAVIAHGGVIRRIYAELLGVNKESNEIKIEDCAYVELEVKEGKVEIISSEGIEILT